MNSLEHDDKKSHLPLLGVGPLYIPLHSHQRFEILFFYTLSMHNFSFVRIAKDLDGFKIIQISDLHNASFGKDNHRLLELIEKQNPDPSCADIFHPFLFHKCDHLPITSKNKSSSVGSIRWMRTGGMSWSARKCSRAGKRSGFTSFRQLFPMVSISGNALRICATASLLIFSYTCIGRRFYSCHQFLIFRIVLHPSKRRIGKCLFLLFLLLLHPIYNCCLKIKLCRHVWMKRLQLIGFHHCQNPCNRLFTPGRFLCMHGKKGGFCRTPSSSQFFEICMQYRSASSSIKTPSSFSGASIK